VRFLSFEEKQNLQRNLTKGPLCILGLDGGRPLEGPVVGGRRKGAGESVL